MDFNPKDAIDSNVGEHTMMYMIYIYMYVYIYIMYIFVNILKYMIFYHIILSVLSVAVFII